MKSIFVTLLFLLTTFFTYGQVSTDWCGSDAKNLSREERQAALDFYRQLPSINVNSRAVDSVALTVHIIASVSGAGSTISQEEIEEQIDIMNSAFGSGIVFFLCGSPRFEQGLSVYDFNSGSALNRGSRVPNTINIFIVEDLQVTNDFGLCGYAVFPWSGKPEDRYVMMNLACWNDGSTLAHELGHFYGLWHTHTTANGFEFADGSNCQTAGDLICDTPADPNLSRTGAISGCNYIGNFVDPRGERYAPPVSNIMSYAPSFCQRDLTPGQKNVIKAINETENNYLISNCDFYPDFGVSSETSEINIRSDEDISLTYNFTTQGIQESYEVAFKVLLRDSDGSNLLLHEEIVQIQEGQQAFSRTLDLDFPITKGTGEYILDASIDSELEVIERTESNNQAISTIKVDNSSLDDVLIFPNPVVDQLKLFFRDNRATGAFSMKVFAIDGRFIQEGEGFKNQEEFFQVIDVSNMNKGLYILKIDFEKVNREYVFKFLKM